MLFGQGALRVVVPDEEDLDGRTEVKSYDSEQSAYFTSSYSERTLYEAMSSWHRSASESDRPLRDIAGIPYSQINEATSTSKLNLQNLEKHNKETDRAHSKYNINPRTRQQDHDALKEALKTLGVELDDETIDNMLPTLAGATILKRFALDRQDRTTKVKLYEKVASDIKEDRCAVSLSDLEDLLANTAPGSIKM